VWPRLFPCFVIYLVDQFLSEVLEAKLGLINGFTLDSPPEESGGGLLICLETSGDVVEYNDIVPHTEDFLCHSGDSGGISC
jgi:hypothetical protein